MKGNAHLYIVIFQQNNQKSHLDHLHSSNGQQVEIFRSITFKYNECGFAISLFSYKKCVKHQQRHFKWCYCEGCKVRKIWIDILTHWGRVTHICVSKITIIGSDNGLSPGRRQAIIWTNAGLLLNGSLGTNFTEILLEILTFSFKEMRLKVSSAKWRPFCLSLNVLNFHRVMVRIPWVQSLICRHWIYEMSARYIL